MRALKTSLLLLCGVLASCSTLPDAIDIPDAPPLSPRLVLPVATSASVSDSFVAAETRLRAAIAGRGLTLHSVVDHGGGALLTGRGIGPSKLFLFGDPLGDADLLAVEPRLGYSLPLKVLLYTDRTGKTKLLYTDAPALGEHYGLDGEAARIDVMRAMLREIARETAG